MACSVRRIHTVLSLGTWPGMKVKRNRPLKLPSRPARVRAESKILWNEGRSTETADFFTIGYEGCPTDKLIERLLSAGVRSMIDVRHTPISMYRPDLSKKNFQRILLENGIDYLHVPQLGIPKDIRIKAIHSGTRQTIWDWYDKWVVEKFIARDLHWFLNIEHPVAMLCVESDPEECHRHRLSNALERIGLGGYDL